MTLDRECCDGSYVLETISLLKALKDLQKKGPVERVCESCSKTLANDAKILERNVKKTDITLASCSDSVGVTAKNHVLKTDR